jgi:hypothetical protein
MVGLGRCHLAAALAGGGRDQRVARAATDSAFVGGLGVGLVIATDRTSSWWLVLGAALRTSVALGAVPIVSRRDQPARSRSARWHASGHGYDRPPCWAG